jgi:ATP/maltotriose-dependent transcriptional regulator MalT
MEHGDFSRAKEVYEQSLEIYRRLGYQNRLSSGLEGLGNALFALGDYGEARKQLQQSAAIVHALGFPRRLAFTLIYLGRVVHALDDVEEARRLFAEALSIATQAIDIRQQALALNGLGHIAFSLGDYAEAYQFYKQSLPLNQRSGLPLETAVSFSELGQAATALRNALEARQHFREALSLGLEMQLAPPLLETIVGIARLFAMEGVAVRAIELLSLVLNHPASHQELRDRATRLLNQLEAEGSPPWYVAAQEHGQALILENIAAELLAEFLSPDDTLLQEHQRLAQPLSQRELEILRLIAKGYSNREIAGELVFSVGTVKWYVHQIHSKLAVSSRTQAIARARELHLLL